MSLIVDRKYVRLIGMRMERFKQKSQDLYQMRCPICGDSKKSKIKARAYFYVKKGGIFFRCHNCLAGTTLGGIIKRFDPLMYQEYKLETFAEAPDLPVQRFSPLPAVIPIARKMDLPSIADLGANHSARQYIAKRKIPVWAWKELFYTDDFKAFAEEMFDSERLIDKKLIVEPRIVLPFFDQKNIFSGCQGRAIGESKVRYITLKVSEDSPKIFGLERLVQTKPIFVVEGPFDSLFLPNSIAMMDSDLLRVTRVLGKNLDYVFVPDAEPRNKQINAGIRRIIELDYKVVIWPAGIPKDVNDMVLSGIDPVTLANQRTFDGLRASLEFSQWSKV